MTADSRPWGPRGRFRLAIFGPSELPTTDEWRIFVEYQTEHGRPWDHTFASADGESVVAALRALADRLEELEEERPTRHPRQLAWGGLSLAVTPASAYQWRVKEESR